jgi:hypothetical protein
VINCGTPAAFALANKGPTPRSLQAYLGHKNEYPAHCQVHRVVVGSLQGFLALIVSIGAVRSISDFEPPSDFACEFLNPPVQAAKLMTRRLQFS